MRRTALEYKKSRDKLNESIDRYKREITRVKPRAKRKRSSIALKLSRNIRIIKSYSSKLQEFGEESLGL